MKRLEIEDILKPGAIMVTKEIDFNEHPEIKELFARTKREQAKMLKIKNAPFRNYRITI